MAGPPILSFSHPSGLGQGRNGARARRGSCHRRGDAFGQDRRRSWYARV